MAQRPASMSTRHFLPTRLTTRWNGIGATLPCRPQLRQRLLSAGAALRRGRLEGTGGAPILVGVWRVSVWRVADEGAGVVATRELMTADGTATEEL